MRRLPSELYANRKYAETRRQASLECASAAFYENVNRDPFARSQLRETYEEAGHLPVTFRSVSDASDGN